MIRRCTDAEVPMIELIINEAAEKYRGVIPSDCWHEPYMASAELREEISNGVIFWGFEEHGKLIGVMGLQDVYDVTLVRHAYVRPTHQGQGVGSRLLKHLIDRATHPVLIGTWADAYWAVNFYVGHGFRVVDTEQSDRLLRKYWRVPTRQRETAVVLARGDVGISDL